MRGCRMIQDIRCTALLCLLSLRCTPAVRPPESGATPLVAAQTEGPVTLTISAAPGDPQALSPVTVRVVAEAPPGVALKPMDYAQELRSGLCRFDCRIIRTSAPKSPEMEGDRLRWLQEIEIEFLLAGEYELPPVAVTFTDSRGQRDAASPDAPQAKPSQQEVQTDALAIKAVAPAGGEIKPDELSSIKTLEPVELPYRWSRWWWLAPLLVMAGATVLALVVYVLAQFIPPLRRLLTWMRGRWTRMVAAPPPPVIPAHEWARRQFAALLSENLIASGRIREFYFRLSDIVRGYIERRFEVSAPEMTTEEFLATTSCDPRFGERNTSELQRFLSACDLVKFAGFHPDPADADALTRAAMDFVERTCAELPSEDDLGVNVVVEAAA